MTTVDEKSPERIKQNEIIARNANAELRDEISYQMTDVEDDREGSAGAYDETDALIDIMDVTEQNGDAPKMLKTCRTIAIELGWYQVVSEEELSRTIVSSGKKYDFKLGGLKYTFVPEARERQK